MYNYELISAQSFKIKHFTHADSLSTLYEGQEETLLRLLTLWYIQPRLQNVQCSLLTSFLLVIGSLPPQHP